jgi:DNA repair protein RecN (Recombination protein N)
MEKTRFAVHFSPEQPGSAGPKGFDDIEFLIAPNPGEEMRPLAKVASGGELSRLMLALKTVVGVTRTGGAGRDGTKRYAPTFVFDEVDAGIGGRVAESVGQRLKRLARSAQVLCVTHLAQIACFADHHFYVEKFERQGRTLTSVKRLDGEKERAQELARMLSGSQITDAVLKHAGAMLKQAASTAN